MDMSIFYHKTLHSCILLSETVHSIKRKMHTFTANEKGVTAVEYAIVVAGVAAVVAVIFGAEGTVSKLLKSIFEEVTKKSSTALGITPAA